MSICTSTVTNHVDKNSIPWYRKAVHSEDQCDALFQSDRKTASEILGQYSLDIKLCPWL